MPQNLMPGESAGMPIDWWKRQGWRNPLQRALGDYPLTGVLTPPGPPQSPWPQPLTPQGPQAGPPPQAMAAPDFRTLVPQQQSRAPLLDPVPDIRKPNPMPAPTPGAIGQFPQPAPQTIPPEVTRERQMPQERPPRPGYDRTGELEARLEQMNQKPSLKQALLGGLVQGAPVALGAIFGGTTGAAGAVEGVNMVTQQQQQRRDLERRSLQQELENERTRQQQAWEADIERIDAKEKLADEIRRWELGQARESSEFKTREEREAAEFKATEARQGATLAEQIRHNKAVEAQKESPMDKDIESYTSADGQRFTVVFQRPDGSTYEKKFGAVQPPPGLVVPPAPTIIQGRDPATGQGGYYIVPRGGGAAQRIPGSPEPMAARKPATEAEKRAFGFYQRMEDAKTNIDEQEPWISSLGLVGQTYLNWAPNIWQYEEGQRFHQAAANFINAALRRESGAAITDAEYARFAPIYFPAPGDSDATLQQKKRSRESLMNSLKTEAGHAYDEYYGLEETSPGAGGGPTRSLGGELDPMGILK